MKQQYNKTNLPQKKQSTNCFSKKISSWFKFINKNPNIAIIRLQGIISPSQSKFSNNLSLETLREAIDEAFNLTRLKAVVLQIDCPGGSPVQSELIYRYIRNKAEQNNIEVFCFIEDVAASGGLYLAYIANEGKVYALPSSIVGSIGVRSSGFGFQEAIKKLGIERRIYTQGENKVILDPFLPEKEKDIEIISNIQKDIHEDFKNFVKERRKTKLKDGDVEIFSGEFWSGSKALDLGLIDHIGDMDNVLQEKFGKKINIKKINTEKSWFKRKFKISNLFDAIFDKLFFSISEKIERNKLGL